MTALFRSFADALWRWRGGVIVLAVLAACAALAVNVYRDRAVQPLILRAMDVAPRMAMQLRLAQAQLHATALETRAGGPPAVLRQRYEAFVSGIRSLGSGEGRALLGDLPRFGATLDSLRAFQARIDDRLGPSLDMPASIAVEMPPAAVEEMLSLLPQLGEPLSELAASAAAAQRLEIVRLTRLVRIADRLQIAAAALALALVLLLAAATLARSRHAGLLPAAQAPHGVAPAAPERVGPAVLAATARDIAAPLHRIAGTFGVILEQAGLEAAHLRAVRAARDAAEDMLATADVLLDAASLAGGRAAPAEALFAADEALARAIRGLEGRIAEMGGRVVVSRDPGVAADWVGDGARLATLVRMLVLRCLPLRPGSGLMLRLTQEAGGSASRSAIRRPRPCRRRCSSRSSSAKLGRARTWRRAWRLQRPTRARWAGGCCACARGAGGARRSAASCPSSPPRRRRSGAPPAPPSPIPCTCSRWTTCRRTAA